VKNPPNSCDKQSRCQLTHRDLGKTEVRPDDSGPISSLRLKVDPIHVLAAPEHNLGTSPENWRNFFGRKIFQCECRRNNYFSYLPVRLAPRLSIKLHRTTRGGPQRCGNCGSVIEIAAWNESNADLLAVRLRSRLPRHSGRFQLETGFEAVFDPTPAVAVDMGRLRS